MKEPSSDTRHNEQKVMETYHDLAEKVLQHGYRHNPIYLARKAVVDWDLMQSAGIEGKDVLNVGCFEPIDELIWAASVRSWTAVDLSPQAIRTARTLIDTALAPAVSERIRLEVMDAQLLGFPDKSFDVAISFSVFDHIPDAGVRQRSINEMARVVRPGGHVVITVPNRRSYYRRLYERNVRRGVDLDVGYQYFYTKTELRRSMMSAGLRPVRFTSDMKNVGDLPRWLRAPLMPLLPFGDRMGYLMQRPDDAA